MKCLFPEVAPTLENHTWFFVPRWLAGYLNAPPPQAQGAVQQVHGLTVSLLIELSINEVFSQLGHVAAVLFNRWPAVLVPVLSAHGHRQVHCGQKTQHWTDDQSCGVPIINHDGQQNSSAKQYDTEFYSDQTSLIMVFPLCFQAPQHVW